MEGYEGHVTFYVGVPDVEAALVKAESLGGKRLFGPEAVPGALRSASSPTPRVI
jgi:uncharacterized protein